MARYTRLPRARTHGPPASMRLVPSRRAVVNAPIIWRRPARPASYDSGVAEDRTQAEREAHIEAELRRQAATYKRLTPEQERELLGRRPDAGAVATLVEHNLDLVVRQAE